MLRCSFPTPLLPAAALGLTLLAACNQQPPAAQEKPAPAAPVIPGPELAAMRDSNAVALLTAYGKEHPETQVLFHTSMGDVKVKLYEDTPLHRASFLLLTNKGYFDQTVFYRVEKGFVVQGGNSDKREIKLGKYHIPPEFRSGHFHRRGALGMARYDDEKNPGKLSSSHDFYFTVGQKYTPQQAQSIAGRKLTPEELRTYATVGGAPALDGQYTVFGEVIEGMDVVEKINQVPVDPYNWPEKDVTMKVEVMR